MKIVDKKSSRSEQKRLDIIEAATQEFKLSGFGVASMDDIAARAGASKRTVYNHFPSKEALFQAIIVNMMATLCTFECDEFSPEQDLTAQLTQLALAEISMLSELAFQDMAKVIIAEAIHKPQLIEQAMAQFSQQESPLEAWFIAALDAGALTARDSQFVLTQFTALIKGFCFWPQLIQGQPFPDVAAQQQIAESAAQMVISHYTPK
ncbi:TetR/AcrR family transcriptional regulator [Shewanella waksmanii]|uniref:TetR/AcrR family transcriptional regulator n=1 Tax=Shewanella waksmanii TaxID=213783 RepID=UPI001FDFC40B|nr:TetR/AcrR family transcriptional regulator [Shewanella waksmanii]